VSRRPPPSVDERRTFIEKNDLVHGTRVLDVELNKIAFVVDHTRAFMVRIRYEEPVPAGKPESRRFKLVNPVTRLRKAS